MRAIFSDTNRYAVFEVLQAMKANKFIQQNVFLLIPPKRKKDEKRQNDTTKSK